MTIKVYAESRSLLAFLNGNCRILTVSGEPTKYISDWEVTLDTEKYNFTESSSPGFLIVTKRK